VGGRGEQDKDSLARFGSRPHELAEKKIVSCIDWQIRLCVASRSDCMSVCTRLYLGIYTYDSNLIGVDLTTVVAFIWRFLAARAMLAAYTCTWPCKADGSITLLRPSMHKISWLISFMHHVHRQLNLLTSTSLILHLWLQHEFASQVNKTWNK
jgi:hypothetical protein